MAAPPTPDLINPNPREVSSLINGDAIIPCRMTANPPPRIRWYKNNRKINLMHRKYTLQADNSLRIHRVASTDGGRYVCVAQNNAGVKTLGVDMTVKGE